MNELVDIWLIGFEPECVEDAPSRMQEVFRIDAGTARELVRTLPRSVKQRLPRPDADRFVAALRTIGGKVEVLPAGSPAPERRPQVVSTEADGGLLDLSADGPVLAPGVDDVLLGPISGPASLASGSIDEDIPLPLNGPPPPVALSAAELPAGPADPPADPQTVAAIAPGDDDGMLQLADVEPLPARPTTAPDPEQLVPRGHIPLPVRSREPAPPPEPGKRLWLVAGFCAVTVLARFTWATEPPVPEEVRDLTRQMTARMAHQSSGEEVELLQTTTAEAMGFLGDANALVPEESLSRSEIQSMVMQFYDEGAVEVMFVDIQRQEGMSTSSVMAVELPPDRIRRGDVFHVYRQIAGSEPAADQGQSHLFVDLR